MENKIKHLEIIQGVINRMASNSFYLKGWAVTLISGIFVLANKDTDKYYFLVAYIPILVFWFIDSYYLLQERLYREHYNVIRKSENSEINFDMNANKYKGQSSKLTFLNTFLSISELWFYLPLALLSTGIIIITHI